MYMMFCSLYSPHKSRTRKFSKTIRRIPSRRFGGFFGGPVVGSFCGGVQKSKPTKSKR